MVGFLFAAPVLMIGELLCVDLSEGYVLALCDKFEVELYLGEGLAVAGLAVA